MGRHRRRRLRMRNECAANEEPHLLKSVPAVFPTYRGGQPGRAKQAVTKIVTTS